MVGILDYKHIFICTYSSCASGFYHTSLLMNFLSGIYYTVIYYTVSTVSKIPTLPLPLPVLCCSCVVLYWCIKLEEVQLVSDIMAQRPQLLRKVFHIRKAVDINKFLVLIPNFISIVEEEAIIQFLSPKLQRKRYESGHWDNVIHKYKETEILSKDMPDVVLKMIERFSCFIRETTGSSQMKFMSPHVLDLSSEGHIGRWCLLAK